MLTEFNLLCIWSGLLAVWAAILAYGFDAGQPNGDQS